MITGEPNGFICGIIDLLLISREYKRLVGPYVIVNFDVGSVPGILSARKLIAYILYSLPIIISVKFIDICSSFYIDSLARLDAVKIVSDHKPNVDEGGIVNSITVG